MLVKVVGSRRALKSKTRALGCSQGISCLTEDLREGLAEISVPSSALRPSEWSRPMGRDPSWPLAKELVAMP